MSKNIDYQELEEPSPHIVLALKERILCVSVLLVP